VEEGKRLCNVKDRMQKVKHGSVMFRNRLSKAIEKWFAEHPGATVLSIAGMIIIPLVLFIFNNSSADMGELKKVSALHTQILFEIKLLSGQTSEKVENFRFTIMELQTLYREHEMRLIEVEKDNIVIRTILEERVPRAEVR
jgi:hypothetical protein